MNHYMNTGIPVVPFGNAAGLQASMNGSLVRPVVNNSSPHIGLLPPPLAPGEFELLDSA